jgi:DNA-directed RNA polymerase specialized sigma24 family protein
VGDVSSEPQPLEAVYRSTWLALTRLAYLLVGDRSEAEDIVQTVFTTAVTRGQTIEELGAYLRRAAVNRANRRAVAPDRPVWSAPVLTCGTVPPAAPSVLLDGIAELPSIHPRP